MKDKTQANVKKGNNFEKEVLKQNAPLKKPTLSKDYFTLHNEYLNLENKNPFIYCNQQSKNQFLYGWYRARSNFLDDIFSKIIFIEIYDAYEINKWLRNSGYVNGNFGSLNKTNFQFIKECELKKIPEISSFFDKQIILINIGTTFGMVLFFSDFINKLDYFTTDIDIFAFTSPDFNKIAFFKEDFEYGMI